MEDVEGPIEWRQAESGVFDGTEGTTFPDDYIQLNDYPPRKATLVSLGLTWPPPDILIVGGVRWEKRHQSLVTDERRANMSNVMRGAEYFPA